MKDYDELLRLYRSLWVKRKLPAGENSEMTLMNAIKSELLDEWTHPRLRRPLYEKFYAAVGRLLQSSLLPDEQLALIRVYKSVADRLIKEK